MGYSTFTEIRKAHEYKLQQARQIMKSVEESKEMPAERKAIWMEWHKAEEKEAMAALNELCQEFYGQGYEACFWS